jgi:hypothetical protein
MKNDKLRAYINTYWQRGYEPDQIEASLLSSGVEPSLAHEAILDVKEERKKASLVPLPPFKQAKGGLGIELSQLSASQILLFLGALIVVLAGIFYVGINWSQWGSFGRIAAIFLPMVICYLVGANLFVGEHNKSSMAFLLSGGLLFPFFLIVTFNELQLFRGLGSDVFSFWVSSLTVLSYIISDFFFGNSIWAFLYELVGLWAYYFFLKLMGVPSVFTATSMAWYLLIVAIGYIAVAPWYEKRGKIQTALHSHGIGILVVCFSFLRFYARSLTNESTVWLLVLFGIFSIVAAMAYEKSLYKKYCRSLYGLGVIMLVLSFIRLSWGGLLIRQLFGMQEPIKDIGGWSVVLVGIVMAAVGYFAKQLASYPKISEMKIPEAFDAISCLWILGGLLFLGLGGNNPLYETLLLIVSVAFIFASIPRKAQSYLVFGTLFLIIYIFSIGGEYFQNDVGWPITLFVAGLASMGVGIMIEKMRKRYFISSEQIT